MNIYLPYQYRPLSDPTNIRLFLLQPGLPAKGSITGHLFGFPAQLSPPFNALSYVCGPDDAARPRYHISIIQHGHTYTHKVLANFLLALNYIRHSDAAIFLWIDAICINSGDQVERGAQAQMMSSTFGCAQQVISWIKPAKLREFAQVEKLVLHECWQSVPTRLSAESEVLAESYLPLWRTLLFFMRNEYWTRRWIAQEVMLARRYVLRGPLLNLDHDRITQVMAIVKSHVLRGGLKIPKRVQNLLHEIVFGKTGFKQFTTFAVSESRGEYAKLEHFLTHSQV